MPLPARLRITTALQRYVNYGKHKSSPVVVTERLDIVAQPSDANEEALAQLRAAGLPDAKAQPATWARFLHTGVPQLRSAGWQIDVDPDVRDVVLDLSVDNATWTARLDSETGDWFDLDLGVQIAGEHVPLLPLIVDVLRTVRDGQLPQTDVTYATMGGRVFVLPMERIRSMLQTLVELLDEAHLDPLGRIALNRLAAIHVAQQVESIETHGASAAAIATLAQHLHTGGGIPDLPAPSALRAELRHYQHEGFRWLQFLYEYRCGGILADDMGLGKSIQAIAHLLCLKQHHAEPSLLVVPTSLVPNWIAEIKRFAPSLRVVTMHGAQRARLVAQLEEADVVITTYALLTRDDIFLQREWNVCILDEAQAIKNPLSKVSRAARKLRARQRLCLTGTPMENHLGELWSLFDFVMPHALYDQRRFAKIFRTPIEQERSSERRDALARRIRPFVLRRTKAEVAMELPEKTEIVERVELAGDQRDLYESVRLAVNEEVRREIARLGIARSRIAVLDALLKLRQTCCDPRLVDLPSARRVRSSAKLEWLVGTLAQLADEGRKTLVFSQFTSMIDLIKPELARAGIPYVELVGSTVDRATPVRRFQAGEVPVFLISLRAGGTGLNLTAADTVIHYDPWWNPAVEGQATDRAHRIGQDKPVFVYKLIAAGTVEEKILDLQARKAQLADALFETADAATIHLRAEDLDELFAPLPA
jgi:hypothetical protein